MYADNRATYNFDEHRRAHVCHRLPRHPPTCECMGVPPPPRGDCALADEGCTLATLAPVLPFLALLCEGHCRRHYGVHGPRSVHICRKSKQQRKTFHLEDPRDLRPYGDRTDPLQGRTVSWSRTLWGTSRSPLSYATGRAVPQAGTPRTPGRVAAAAS